MPLEEERDMVRSLWWQDRAGDRPNGRGLSGPGKKWVLRVAGLGWCSGGSGGGGQIQDSFGGGHSQDLWPFRVTTVFSPGPMGEWGCFLAPPSSSRGCLMSEGLGLFPVPEHSIFRRGGPPCHRTNYYGGGVGHFVCDYKCFMFLVWSLFWPLLFLPTFKDL